MKMDVIATTKRSVAIALGLVLVIGLVLLAWIGSELHYGNCLTKEHQAGKTGGAARTSPERGSRSARRIRHSTSSLTIAAVPTTTIRPRSASGESRRP